MYAAKWISLRNTHVKVEVWVTSVMSDSATPWTVAHQAPLSMEFSLEAYWSGLSFPSPGDLPDTGIEPGSPALQVDSLPSEPPEKPRYTYIPCFVFFFFYFSFRSIFRDRDGPRDCHTEWSKSEREKQISWINTYTRNLENGTDEPICKADTETDRVNCCIPHFKHTQTNYLGMLLLWGNRELKRNSFPFKVIVLISLTDFIIDVIKALKMYSSNWISQNGEKKKEKKISC